MEHEKISRMKETIQFDVPLYRVEKKKIIHSFSENKEFFFRMFI